MKWKIMATGLVTPWYIGSLIKIYILSLHKITFPWSYFLKPQGLAVIIPASIWWGIPFIALAFLSRLLIKKDFLGRKLERGKFQLLMGALVGSFIEACRMFLSVFWLFDPIIIMVPIWIFYVKDVLIGLFICWLIGKRIDCKIIDQAQTKNE